MYHLMGRFYYLIAIWQSKISYWVFLFIIETTEIKSGYALEPSLFGKWTYKGIECEDISLEAYASLKPTKVNYQLLIIFYKYNVSKFISFNSKQESKVINNLWFRVVESKYGSHTLQENIKLNNLIKLNAH